MIGLGDLVEQCSDIVATGADDLGAAVADRAIDQPGADGVHLLDAGQIDGQRIGSGVDLALGRRGAGDRQRPAEAIAGSAARVGSARCSR